MKKNNILTILQYIFFGSMILYFGRAVFIPIAYACLISFILYPLCSWLEKKGFSRILSISVGIGLVSIFFLAVVLIMANQFAAFVAEWSGLKPKFETSLNSLREYFTSSFNISPDQQEQWLIRLPEQLSGSILIILKDTVSFSATSLVMGILIPVYVVLILYYRGLWKLLLCRMLPGESSEDVTRMITLTIGTYFNFVKGMGIVYLCVGILNSAGLLLLGIPHAFLFGFIASILTFIPYVGIMVGALLPVTIAWMTNDSLWYPAGVIAVFVFVQYLEANVIFPFAVSSRLKVNTMAVLVAIFIGELVWGISGMILFVPFAGILKLIADNNPRWKIISLGLGTTVAPSNEGKEIQT